MKNRLIAMTALAVLVASGLRPPATRIEEEAEPRNPPAGEKTAEELRREYLGLLSQTAEAMTPEELQEAVDELRLRLIAGQLEQAAERHPGSTLEYKAQLAADVLLTDDLDVLDAVATALDWEWESDESEVPGDDGILTVRTGFRP